MMPIGTEVILRTQPLSLLVEAREIEIGCDECFERLDGFAEVGLSGVDASAAMPLVRDHLDKCADCRSELETLLRSLHGT